MIRLVYRLMRRRTGSTKSPYLDLFAFCVQARAQRLDVYRSYLQHAHGLNLADLQRTCLVHGIGYYYRRILRSMTAVVSYVTSMLYVVVCSIVAGEIYGFEDGFRYTSPISLTHALSTLSRHRSMSALSRDRVEMSETRRDATQTPQPTTNEK